jgi:hypothetical protein
VRCSQQQGCGRLLSEGQVPFPARLPRLLPAPLATIAHGPLACMKGRPRLSLATRFFDAVHQIIRRLSFRLSCRVHLRKEIVRNLILVPGLECPGPNIAPQVAAPLESDSSGPPIPASNQRWFVLFLHTAADVGQRIVRFRGLWPPHHDILCERVTDRNEIRSCAFVRVLAGCSLRELIPRRLARSPLVSQLSGRSGRKGFGQYFSQSDSRLNDGLEQHYLGILCPSRFPRWSITNTRQIAVS